VAFADLSLATEPTMTFQILVGNESNTRRNGYDIDFRDLPWPG